MSKERKTKNVISIKGFSNNDIERMVARAEFIHKIMCSFDEMDESYHLFEGEKGNGIFANKDYYRVYAMNTKGRNGCGDRNVAKVVMGGDVYYYRSNLMGDDGTSESAWLFMQNKDGDIASGVFSKGRESFFNRNAVSFELFNPSDIINSFINNSLKKVVGVIDCIGHDYFGDRFAYDKGVGTPDGMGFDN